MNAFRRALIRVGEALRRIGSKNNFTCDVCGREVFACERICAQCMRTLPFQTLVCPLCGRRVREAGVCAECKQKPPLTDKARSVFSHEGEAARLVVGFKNGRRYLCGTLAELALPVLMREFPDAEIITCVPMTKKAQKRRGYNQSALFAEELAKLSGKTFLETAVKNSETEMQKTLGRRAREKNLEGRFHISHKKTVAGKILLIADDTLTTGATVSFLADALKRAGAKKVYALTVTGVEYKAPFGKLPNGE